MHMFLIFLMSILKHWYIFRLFRSYTIRPNHFLFDVIFQNGLRNNVLNECRTYIFINYHQFIQPTVIIYILIFGYEILAFHYSPSWPYFIHIAIETCEPYYIRSYKFKPSMRA